MTTRRAEPAIIAFSVRAYQALLLAYPARFRREYAFLTDQAALWKAVAPSECRLAVGYLSLPALDHGPRQPVVPITQLVARLEQIVGGRPMRG